MSHEKTKLSELENKKEQLHKLIDNIGVLDYVEMTTKIVDVTGKTKIVHQIYVEKNGNVFIKKTPAVSRFDSDE